MPNQYNWTAPTDWPSFDSPQADFKYSVLAIDVDHYGTQDFTNYPFGPFGDSRFGIGAFLFDNVPVEIRNMVLSQPDGETMYVKIDFEIRDIFQNTDLLTYEWKLSPSGTYQQALMAPPLIESVNGDGTFQPITVYWDIRNEPAFALTSAPQTIIFRITATDGNVIRSRESDPTLVMLNDEPLITSLPGQTAFKGQEYVYIPVAIDAQNDITSWDLIGAPIDMQFNSLTGAIRWTPQTESIDPLNLTLKVFDAKGTSDSQSWILRVSKAKVPLGRVAHFPTVTKDLLKTGMPQISIGGKNRRNIEL